MIKINLAKADLKLGDCLEVLKSMPENSVDSVVTDPPYGLSFMGKKWDYQVPSSETFKEILRVLKPGGHALIACGTRTQHRMAVNIEDAGFEIRDVITWLYGSGFPKSMNLKEVREGWGTALKPACEFWTMARKPLSEKTVAANMIKHGVGGLNIDDSRIEGEAWKPHDATGLAKNKFFTDGEAAVIHKEPHDGGRWPANLILDEEAAVILDEQTGILKSGSFKEGQQSKESENLCMSGKNYARIHKARPADQGGASRFFYVAKASKSEKNANLNHLEAKESGVKNDSGRGFSESDPYKKVLNQNNHPTVKPVKLMSYLVKLVTPENGIVLDPFMGSGSTGVAAIAGGFEFIGIEREESYFEICKGRIGA